MRQTHNLHCCELQFRLSLPDQCSVISTHSQAPLGAQPFQRFGGQVSIVISCNGGGGVAIHNQSRGVCQCTLFECWRHADIVCQAEAEAESTVDERMRVYSYAVTTACLLVL